MYKYDSTYTYLGFSLALGGLQCAHMPCTLYVVVHEYILFPKKLKQKGEEDINKVIHAYNKSI
jgi:hypothetical protein